MSGFSWLSGISIFCYVFLLVSLLAARKKEQVILSFIQLLLIMTLWTGGSVGMRTMLWPGVNFWHHVSLLGMMTLPFGYYQFVQDFIDEKKNSTRYLLLLSCIVVFIINLTTGIFIPLPKVVSSATGVKFLYLYTWHVYLLAVFMALALTPIYIMFRRFCRGNRVALQQLAPVLTGLAIIFLGNTMSTLPIFVGIPVDMLSGAVNAIVFFYALYKKNLFPMTILFSKANCVIIAMMLGLLVASDIALVIQHHLLAIGLSYLSTLILILTFIFLVILALYFSIHRSLDAVFTRTEKKQQALLARFGEEITHMMSVSEILQLLSDTIQSGLPVTRLFILIRGLDGNYHIEHTNNPLDEKNFFFRADHPLISHFKERQSIVLMQDFIRKTIYRSMWETEKDLLTKLQIDCFIPLNSQDGLAGFILLSDTAGKLRFNNQNLDFLQSAANTCGNSVSHAYTYERAVEEAQKDDLTGLVNFKFFFEILEREFEHTHDSALSLCIINIDDFKLYNQLYGTREGDIALQRIAAVLASSIGETSYAARITGDEFALILPGYDIYSAKCLADNIAEQIGQITVSDTAGRLSVSIGICAAPYMASSAKELYRNAETTVYTIKRTGKNAVQMYSTELDTRKENSPLFKSAYNEHASTIYALTAAIDAKDHYTYRHSQNVAYYASELAKAAGMSPDMVELVREAGLLHDIGKIGIREEILNKPEKLTPDEFELMKTHVDNAVNIIRHLPSLDYVIPVVLSHHERYDGKGYPRKLAGDNIPITGRILCIADSFDAITSVRNYKPAVPLEKAISIMRSESGCQFDPHLVDIFIDLVESGKLELCSTLGKEAMPSVPELVGV